jgi:MFS family permease
MLKGVYYGWVVVAVAVLATLFSAGIRSVPGTFLLPVQDDMGWSKTVLSLATSVGLLLFGLLAPFSGALMDRIGPRRITLTGLVVMSLSMAGSALMTQTSQLVLFWGFLSGIGTGMVGSVLGAAVANRWFIRNRGLVTGIFGAAASAGQLIFIPVLVYWATGIGWREASWIMAAMALLVTIPLFVWLKDTPAQANTVPLGAVPGEVHRPARPQPGIMRQAVQSRDFWLLAGTFFICGATSNGLIGVHLIPYAVDCGLTQTTASGILAVLGAMNFVGTLASGWLTDRYDPRLLLSVYYGIRGLSLLLLPFTTTAETMIIFALLFGLDYIATVPPTIALVADRFGRGNVGLVYGWVFASHQIGAASASWAGGVVRDTLGEYNVIFLAGGLIGLAAAALSWQIRRTAQPAVA